MSKHQNLNTQPEQDIPPAQLASLSLGLMLGSGLIIGAMLGALAGHFLLDDAFGWGQDIVIGAVIGAILGAIVMIGGVTAFSNRLRHKNS